MRRQTFMHVNVIIPFQPVYASIRAKLLCHTKHGPHLNILTSTCHPKGVLERIRHYGWLCGIQSTLHYITPDFTIYSVYKKLHTYTYHTSTPPTLHYTPRTLYTGYTVYMAFTMPLHLNTTENHTRRPTVVFRSINMRNQWTHMLKPSCQANCPKTKITGQP